MFLSTDRRKFKCIYNKFAIIFDEVIIIERNRSSKETYIFKYKKKNSQNNRIKYIHICPTTPL